MHPFEMPVYARLPLTLVRGRGAYVYDAAGRRFLDFYGGHAVAVTGHCHPTVVAALAAQAEQLLFYSNAVDLPARGQFFDALQRLVPAELDRAFVISTGAEANEQAVQLARRRTGRGAVVSVEGGFHGRTLATLALSGLPAFRRRAELSPAGRALTALTRVCPFDDAEALAGLVTRDTAAVLVEPVQGLAGARDVAPAFLQTARAVCDATGAALIFDEVQSGCGRTGAFSAAQRYGVIPDLMTLAKGLASGVPMGAVLARSAWVADLGSGDLGTTFGAGPLACAAGAASLQVLHVEALADNARRRGAELSAALAAVRGVVRVRGLGLLIGVVLDRPARPVQEALFERGVLVGSAADSHTLRLLPPLVIQDAECEQFLTAFREVSA